MFFAFSGTGQLQSTSFQKLQVVLLLLSCWLAVAHVDLPPVTQMIDRKTQVSANAWVKLLVNDHCSKLCKECQNITWTMNC